MAHLAAVARLPNITIQVVPAIAHAGLLGGFSLTERAAYVETAVAGQVFEDAEIIAGLLTRFDTLRNEALRASESLAFIERIVRGMESNWRKSSYSGDNGGACVEIALRLRPCWSATPPTAAALSSLSPLTHGERSLRPSGNSRLAGSFSALVKARANVSRGHPRATECARLQFANWPICHAGYVMARCPASSSKCVPERAGCQHAGTKGTQTMAIAADRNHVTDRVHAAEYPVLGADGALLRPGRTRLPRARRLRRRRRNGHLRTRHQRDQARGRAERSASNSCTWRAPARSRS